MGMFDGSGRRRRQRRRQKRRSGRAQRRGARQQARQARRQTRVAGRFDPDVVLARTQGRQQLMGQALELGSQFAEQKGWISGQDAATAAYTGSPMDEFSAVQDDYYEEDEEGGMEPWMIAAIAAVGIGVVVMATRK